MKIKAIHHAAVPLPSNIRNAVIDFSQMTFSLVVVESDIEDGGKPLCGFGFNSNGRYAQPGLIDERCIPRLISAEPSELTDAETGAIDPVRCGDVMMRNEKPGGHGERPVAVGTIDMALWDLVSKAEGQPLYQHLARRFHVDNPNPEIYCYAAGGYYYPGKGLEQLREEIEGYLALGYRDVKMKIGGASLAEDITRIEAALDVLGGDGSRLAVDANGRFDLPTALEYGKAMESYGLKWYEEAGDPLDYQLQAALSANCSLPMATGENLFSMTDTRNLVRYAGMNASRDYIQVDPALSYGLPEYLRMLDAISVLGWKPDRCIPHGGHQFTLHIAAAFGLHGNESYPGVFQPFGGFGDDVPVRDSVIRISDTPGVGIEIKANLMDLYRKTFPQLSI